MKELGYRAPFYVMLILGVFFCLQHYVSHPAVDAPTAAMKQWKQPLGATMMLLAAFGVIALHARRVARLERRWGYSAVTVASAVAMGAAGILGGVQDGSLFATWFKHLVTPLESTMFSLLAFFVASAAFRAFRARTAGATILLASATVVLLALIPAVEQSIPLLDDAAAFLLEYPNTAAKRAIMIGVALGALSVALKTIFGIDRTILGKER